LESSPYSSSLLVVADMITTAVVNVAAKKPSAAANAVAIKTVKRSLSAAAKVASAARANQSNRSSL